MQTPPKPVPTQVVCSACGLDWGLHEESIKESKQPSVNLETCVVLLKAELSKRRAMHSINTATAGTGIGNYWFGYQ